MGGRVRLLDGKGGANRPCAAPIRARERSSDFEASPSAWQTFFLLADTLQGTSAHLIEVRRRSTYPPGRWAEHGQARHRFALRGLSLTGSRC